MSNLKEWHKWFAWYPVKVDKDKPRVFFKTVERRLAKFIIFNKEALRYLPADLFGTEYAKRWCTRIKYSWQYRFRT